MNIIDYFVMVHKVIEVYSRKFQLRLRRNNYVTPKNYLDFISTYLKLLDEKDKSIQAQVRKTFNYNQWNSTDAVLEGEESGSYPLLLKACQPNSKEVWGSQCIKW